MSDTTNPIIYAQAIDSCQRRIAGLQAHKNQIELDDIAFYKERLSLSEKKVSELAHEIAVEEATVALLNEKLGKQ